jgi:hypothetical protein
MAILSMGMRDDIRQSLRSFFILAHAVIYKLTKSFFNKPILILRRKIKKQHPFHVDFAEFKALRPEVSFIFITEQFSVVGATDDLEVENASQRLVQFKLRLVSQPLISKENYLSELNDIDFNFEGNQGLLSSYNYSEAVSNIAHLFLRASEGKKEVPLDHNLEMVLKRLLDHVSDNPEYYYFVTNNHLLNNARALLLGGLVLRDHIYISRGVEVLNLALLMFQPTGIFRERSSHYHLIIFLWLQDILSVFNQIKFDGADGIKEKISLLLAANSEVTGAILDHSSSLIPLVGDVSPDESPRYTSQFARHVYTCLPSADRKAGWEASGGWYFFKGAAWSAICCPQDKLSLEYPTHGHDDWGAFCLSKSGEDVLIDIGRYSYSKNPLSLHQISREGHSSVSIALDGKSAMVVAPFSKPTYRRTNLSRKIVLERDVLSLTEKYRKKGFQYHWTRRMAAIEGLFNILDTIFVSQACKVIFTFFFSKQWYNSHSESVKFDFGQDNYIQEGCIKGIQEVECSEEYLRKTVAIRLTLSVNVTDSFTLNTSFV